MRDNMPVILILLVVMFLLMIIFEWGMDYLGLRTNRRDYVGIIEGKKITYQEFSDLVKRASDNQKQQTGQEPDDNGLQQIRDQVWNNLVTQTLVDNETKRVGIKVTDQEIVDWVRGDNPPDFLVSQFKDSTGRFNRAAYESAINDPRNKDIWIQVETALRQERLSEQMQSLVLASVRATPGELEERFIDQNTKINAQYALYDPNIFVADSAVTVTDDDMRKYYNEHQDEFKVKATRKLKYVLFNNQPSAGDSQDVRTELNEIQEQIKAGLDFLDILKNHSETPFSDVFFKHGQLSAQIENAVFSAKVGDVVGPISDGSGYHLIKILGEKKGTETFIRASHILLNIPPGQEPEVMKKAKDLLTRARKGDNFADLAKQYSQEPGAAQSGGELGWFGKGRMVKPFEDAVMKGRPGEIIGPVKTQFGVHVIKIEGRDDRELKLADIHLTIKASSQTKDAAFQNAQDFAYVAKSGNFEKEANGLNLQMHETQPFPKGAFIPGIGYNQSLSNFSFSGDLGDVSEALQVNEGYAVFKISEIKKEGVRPFDDLKVLLTPRVLREKKMTMLKNIVTKDRSGLQDTSNLGVLQSQRPNVTVQTTGEFGPSTGIPTVGRENAFIGAVLALPVGVISQPVEGTRGFYLIKVLSRTPFDSAAFNAQRTVLAAQVLQEKKQRFMSSWLQNLKDKADIEDKRDLFFR